VFRLFSRKLDTLTQDVDAFFAPCGLDAVELPTGQGS
jgi:hypothetical protein